MENVSCNVESLGYPPLESVATFRSISHLFGTSKNRCGIYILEFPNSVFYIGQAIDVVKRFGQHRRSHENIVGFSFIKCPKMKLDEVEKQLIFDAENLDFVLSNTVHATTAFGETDLDFVVSQEEQEHWLKNPGKVNIGDRSSMLELPENVVHRTRAKYDEFSKREESDVVVELLSTYINCCVPLPRRTEYSFWSMSCLPGTNKSTWPRFAAVSLSVMEVLVIGHVQGSKDELWGFVNVASDILFPPGNLNALHKFKALLPSVEVAKGRYKDPGQHQVLLRTYGANNLKRMLDNKSVQNAAAHLNLRLMKKRPTIYSKFHCSDLARRCVL